MQDKISTFARKSMVALATCLALVLALAVALGVPYGGLKAPGVEKAYAAVTAAGTEEAALVNQLTKATAAMNALPDASKIKLTDWKKIKRANDLVLNVDLEKIIEIGDKGGGTTKYQTAIEQFGNAIDRWSNAYERFRSLLAKEVKAVAKKPVKKVKVTAGKKKATVTWKNFGKGYKYKVYYSLKKKSGYKLAATTSKTKATVKKLKRGKRYYFKVQAYRDNVRDIDFRGSVVIYSKSSAITRSKAIK